jgi:hypothetical protein
VFKLVTTVRPKPGRQVDRPAVKIRVMFHRQVTQIVVWDVSCLSAVFVFVTLISADMI